MQLPANLNVMVNQSTITVFKPGVTGIGLTRDITPQERNSWGFHSPLGNLRPSQNLFRAPINHRNLQVKTN